MGYFVELADRTEMPQGRDWMFIEQAGGDVMFVVARDARRVEITPEILLGVLPDVLDHVDLPVDQLTA